MDERNPQRESEEIGRERDEDDLLADDEDFEDVDELGDEDADDEEDVEE